MKRQDEEMADSVLPRTGGEEGTIGMRRCALAERENYVWVIYIYIYINICMYLDIYIMYVVDENNDSAARVQWVSLEIN